MIVRYGLRIIALGYLLALLIVPVTIIVAHTFSGGLTPVWNAATQHDALRALELTLEIAADHGPAEHHLRDHDGDRDRAPELPRQGAPERASSTCRSRSRRSWSGSP